MRTVFASALLSGLIIASLAGCATSGGGQDSEAALKKSLATFEKSLEDGNTELMAKVISEDFMSMEFGEKDTFLDAMKYYFESGTLQDPEVSFEETVYAPAEGGTYHVNPVMMQDAGGLFALDLMLAQEKDGIWRITKLEYEEF